MIENKYASALDGLEIEDPVESFFDFCKERENIRISRENGEDFPWSKDEIFQNGRFLNVFREDDRVSKSIIKFAGNLNEEPSKLINAVFLARWCNRQEVLDTLTPDDLNNPENLKNKLESIDPWCNETAYPVEPVTWGGKQYSRIDAATKLFYEVQDSLLNILESSNKSVINATNNINKEFQMQNDFPIFMAVIDIAWFRPDIIPIESEVPTGIGAVAYLDRLQNHLGLSSHQEVGEKMIELQKTYWPEAKRGFNPIDIEYLACECRKYYSYINGTKVFEGKNKFIP
jgi:hypothetical protein